MLVNAYIVQVCNPLNTLGFVFRETNDALVNVERMFNILLARGRVREDIDEGDAKPLVVTEGEIRFENVEFGYDPARQILRDVSFNAHAGKKLAVSGRKRLGQIDARETPVPPVSAHGGQHMHRRMDIAEVTQGTVCARRSARATPCSSTIRSPTTLLMDDGLARAPISSTRRSSKSSSSVCVRLSGGERQRIAIACARDSEEPAHHRV